MQIKNIPMSYFWASLATVFLGMGWLLPNHSLPWTSFHSDAWVAIVLCCIGLIVLFNSGGVRIYYINLLYGMVAVLPMMQFALGIFPFVGQAVIATLYLLGFLFAQIVGQQWQKWRSEWLGNILFSAIGMAAIASVGLQLYQWLGLTRDSGATDIWIIGFGGVRPFANLGQPNQLATLLLWGLLACAWGVWKGYLTRFSATLLAAFLLMGLALTQSRSGMIGLCMLVFASWWWLPFKSNSPIRWSTAGLGIFYFLLLWSLRPISELLLLDETSSFLNSESAGVRLRAWNMLADAIAKHPWKGYGWNQVISAHLAVAERHPNVGQLFAQSHNLFLDFIVWAGIPVGVLLSVSLLTWLVVAARRIVHVPDALFFLMLMVIGVHSMLEFPLHYAYFLLPTGIVIGVLNQNLKLGPIARIGLMTHRITQASYLITLVFFGLVMRDYFRIEESSDAIRFEKAHVKVKEPARAPDVLLLTHMQAQLAFFLMEPAEGASKEVLQTARNVTTVFPSYHNFMKLITLLALNDLTTEARQWMVKMPYTVDPPTRLSIPMHWGKIQQSYPALKNLEWAPSMTTASHTDSN